MVRKNFRTAPYFIMHAHLIGDILNNKASYMMLMKYGAVRKFCQNMSQQLLIQFNQVFHEKLCNTNLVEGCSKPDPVSTL